MTGNTDLFRGKLVERRTAASFQVLVGSRRNVVVTDRLETAKVHEFTTTAESTSYLFNFLSVLHVWNEPSSVLCATCYSLHLSPCALVLRPPIVSSISDYSSYLQTPSGRRIEGGGPRIYVVAMGTSWDNIFSSTIPPKVLALWSYPLKAHEARGHYLPSAASDCITKQRCPRFRRMDGSRYKSR